jgi:toxin ParE1/3/4
LISRLEFTPRAPRDIEDIWEYSFERFGLDKAEAYLRGIQHAAMTVTEELRRGLECDEIRSGYRKFSVGSHVLFFRASATRVVIVRILHERINFDRLRPPQCRARQLGLSRSLT